MAEEKCGNSLLWFLAGLGVGAAIGVLYAPKSGREIRDAITEQAEEGRDYVVNQARQAKDQAQQWAEKGRDFYQQQKDQFKSAFGAGKKICHEATEEPGPGFTKKES
jgi:gas vesicle protein